MYACVTHIYGPPLRQKSVEGQLELPWNVLANPSPHATRAARARRGSVEDEPSHPVGIAMSWNHQKIGKTYQSYK
jgi:hypothetical protein